MPRHNLHFTSMIKCVHTKKAIVRILENLGFIRSSGSSKITDKVQYIRISVLINKYSVWEHDHNYCLNSLGSTWRMLDTKKLEKHFEKGQIP